jgi:hypothetical protein
LLADDPVRAIEFPNLAGGSVGDEVHRVVTIPHRQFERIAAERVHAVERHQLPALVRLQLPAGRQVAVIPE